MFIDLAGLVNSEPPTLEPHFYGIGSASTLTSGLGQKPVAPPFPTLGARPPSLQNPISRSDGGFQETLDEPELTKGPSIMSDQAGNHSRQCFMPRNHERILIQALRELGHDQAPGTESRSQSRLDLGSIPPGNEGFVPPQTRNGLKESPSEPENYTGPSHGTFVWRHA